MHNGHNGHSGHNGNLPEGAARIRTLVKRSRSKRNRPRLPDEYENRLQEIDAEMAATYASMEDIGDRLTRCISKIGNDEVVVRDIQGDHNLAAHLCDLADDAGDAVSNRLPMLCAVADKA